MYIYTYTHTYICVYVYNLQLEHLVITGEWKSELISQRDFSDYEYENIRHPRKDSNSNDCVNIRYPVKDSTIADPQVMLLVT